MNRIAFPGLGLEFNISETAFPLFGIDIQWYGIILSTGIVAAFLLFTYLATKREGIILDAAYNLTLIVVPIAIIGARFVYVATNWENRYAGKSFLELINIREGGIAIYGAILFGLATVIVFSKICKIKTFSLLDSLAPAVMLGQIIGRWGNFVNAEAYGWSDGVENLPWRMELDFVQIDGKFITPLPPHTACVHPTFLYESLWNLVGLVLILFLLYRIKKFDGEIFFAYMGWYGIGRAFIEMLRADSLYIVGNLKFSVVVGFACFATAIIGEFLLYLRYKEEVTELSAYQSQFDALKIKLEPHVSSETEIQENENQLEEIGDCDEDVLREQDLIDGDAETEIKETETEE